MSETLIYGLPRGERERYAEQLLYGGGLKLSKDQIERVKAAASADGWHSFRVVDFDPTAKPDFSKAVKRNPMKTTRAKRTPTPAQLAARERFAEMARAGSFKKVGGRKRNPADAAPYTVTWKSPVSGRMQSSNYRTKFEAVRDANALDAEGAKSVEVSKYSPSTGALAVEWRQTNPAPAARVKTNPAAAKGMTFYVHANLGYGKSARFKVTASPGANSARSAANEVAAHLGYPVFVGSRNERPVDGYPVIRYEFIDDAQTKAVDLFVYQVKREGVKYSTIRKTNPAPAQTLTGPAPTARVKSNPARKAAMALSTVYQVQHSKDGKAWEVWGTYMYLPMAKDVANRRAAEAPREYVRVESIKVKA